MITHTRFERHKKTVFISDRTGTVVNVQWHGELCPLVSFKSCVLSRIRVLVILIVCTIAMPKVDTCFWTTYFNRFRAKAPQNSNGFCYFHEGCPKWNLLWKVWLNIPQDGVLVTVFVSHSFSCLIDLKMNTATTTATPMVSFDLVFHKLSKKISFFNFHQGKQGFLFLNGDS